MKKRILCLFLALLMVAGALPASVLAADTSAGQSAKDKFATITTTAYFWVGMTPGGMEQMAGAVDFPALMVIMGVDSSSGTTYYQLRAAEGNSWPITIEGGVQKLSDGVWVKADYVNVQMPAEPETPTDPPTEPSNPPSQPTEPELVENTATSQGSVSGVTATGTMSADAVLTVEPGSASAAAEIMGNAIDMIGEHSGMLYKSYAFDIDLSGQFAGNISVTIPASQIPVLRGDEELRLIHLLDSAEAIQSAKERGTAKTYSASGLAARFPEETAASGQSDTIYYEELDVERDAAGNVVFSTSSFSTFLFTVSFHLQDKLYTLGGEDGIWLHDLLTNLGINKNAEDVTEVETDPYLINAAKEKDSNHYMLTALRPVLDETELKVSFNDGTNLVIKITGTTFEYSIKYYPNYPNNPYVAGQTDAQAGVTMPVQTLKFGQNANLIKNTYPAPESPCTVTFEFHDDAANPVKENVSKTVDLEYYFNGWEDKGTITFHGEQLNYTALDVPFYTHPDKTDGKDVYLYYEYTMGVFNKYGIAMHYVMHGRAEFAAGSEARRPTPRIDQGERPGTYPDGTMVSCMATSEGYTVPLCAQWLLKSITLPNLSREGYRFEGWFTAETGGTKVGDGGDVITYPYNVPVPSAVTLHAQWTPLYGYELILDKNNTDYVVDMPESYPESWESETAVKQYTWEKEPSSTGYTFMGWSTDPNATTGSKIKSYSITGELTKFKQETLYAIWQPSTYILHLNGYGNSNIDQSIKKTVYYNQEIILDTFGFVKDGYVLSRWICEGATDDQDKFYDVGDTVSRLTHSGQTAYVTAIWQPITYEVSFDPNGGSGTMPNQQFTYGVPQNLTVNTLTAPTDNVVVSYDTNTGSGTAINGTAPSEMQLPYKFRGWMDQSVISHHGVEYSYVEFDAPFYANPTKSWDILNAFGGYYDKYAFLNHYVTTGKNEYAGGATGRKPAPTTDEELPGVYPDGALVSNLITTPGEPVSLVAHWLPEPISLPSVSRNGYTFNGWYTAAAGGKIVGAGGAAYQPTESTTLYAHWTANDYTITYRYAYDEIADKTVKYTPDTDLTLEHPTRAGYTFLGWQLMIVSNDSNWTAQTFGTDALHVGTGKYGDITLVAQWQQNKQDLTIRIDGAVSGRNYVFRVFNTSDEKVAEVVLHGGKTSIVIQNLPAGIYTVSAEGNWAWRQDLTMSGSSDLTNGDAAATFTCTAKEGKNRWLNGYTYRKGGG